MEISLPGEPVSTNSIYRFSCNRGFLMKYMSADGKSKKEEYSWLFKSAKPKGWKTDQPYEVTLNLYFKNKRVHDIDNYNKIILDAATGIIWDDDKQITKLTITKAIDKANPRVEVVIHYIIPTR